VPPTLEGGTRVGGPTGARGRAVGVAGMRDLTRVHVRGAARARELVAALGRDAVPLKRFHAGGDGATALFVRDDLPDWPAVRARLGDAVIEEDLAAATVVGEGIGSDPALLARALEVSGADVAGFDASPLRLTLYVTPARLDDVVRALHKVFIGTP
jgi:aspartokinase